MLGEKSAKPKSGPTDARGVTAAESRGAAEKLGSNGREALLSETKQTREYLQAAKQSAEKRRAGHQPPSEHAKKATSSKAETVVAEKTATGPFREAPASQTPSAKGTIEEKLAQAFERLGVKPLRVAKNGAGKEAAVASAGKNTSAGQAPQTDFVASLQETSSAQGARAASKVKSLPPQHQRLFQQVEDGVRQAILLKPRSVSLKLNPEELGEMKVKISVEADQLKAQITADSQKVAAILKENQSGLEQRLREQGMELSKFDVDHEQRQEDSGQNAQRRDGEAANQGRNGLAATRGETNGTHEGEQQTEATAATHDVPNATVVAGRPVSFTV